MIVAGDRRLHAQLRRLGETARMVFVAGLPGMGKSLVIHQLTHLAAAAGRSVHLLQWDVARPVVETSATGRRYPIVDGVTHPVVRKAVGLWARRAVARWQRQWGVSHLLVGETPLVGGRLSELAHVAADEAESILAAPSCRFALPIPSPPVRQVLESERERRMAAPLHPREREDAPPHVLRDLWSHLVGLAPALGIPLAAPSPETPYDATFYRHVYETVLRHRHVEVVALDTVLPTAAFSVYDFATARVDLVPSPEEAEALVLEVEARHPDGTELAGAVERWWAS